MVYAHAYMHDGTFTTTPTCMLVGVASEEKMALLRSLGFKRPYGPKPRYMHYAGAFGGESFIFAGRTVDFNKTKEELSSTIEVFDHYLE